MWCLNNAKIDWNQKGSGADPGILVRGGGPTSRKSLTSKKKKKKKDRQKGKAGRFSITYTLEWPKSNSAIETAFQTITFSSPRCFSPYPNKFYMAVFSNVKFVSDVTVGGGGVLGVLPQKLFGLNGVKSCHFRQNKHGNAFSWKPGIVCMTIWQKGLGT